MVREITLEWPETGQQPRSGHQRWRPWGPHSRPVFVPEHELLLMPNSGRRPSNTQVTYTAFRCGPLKSGDVPLGTSSVPTSDPPSTVAVGGQIRYRPVPGPGATASEFRLKRTLPGMTIDPKTGTLAWRPGREHVGRWPITILATVDGREVTVITWTVEVR